MQGCQQVGWERHAAKTEAPAVASRSIRTENGHGGKSCSRRGLSSRVDVCRGMWGPALFSTRPIQGPTRVSSGDTHTQNVSTNKVYAKTESTYPPSVFLVQTDICNDRALAPGAVVPRDTSKQSALRRQTKVLPRAGAPGPATPYREWRHHPTWSPLWAQCRPKPTRRCPLRRRLKSTYMNLQSNAKSR